MFVSLVFEYDIGLGAGQLCSHSEEPAEMQRRPERTEPLVSSGVPGLVVPLHESWVLNFQDSWEPIFQPQHYKK